SKPMAKEHEIDTTEVPAASSPWRGIASSAVRVDLGGLTHPGKVRTGNEDSFLAARFSRTMKALLTSLPADELPEESTETVYGLAVADGIGGSASGEVASRTALRTMIDLVLRTPDWILRPEGPYWRRVEQRMEHRFHQIQGVLAGMARADPTLF